ncbi:AIM24 family protein [Kineosporia sp. A_224]|uniref:AIM24 family protein n=1 Tax=Kineosporia sp. A_224 TaxID=1962180 RepID=UPI000B4BB9C4|nr:AIM24 family protein [Kineosporia sp. A_224]
MRSQLFDTANAEVQTQERWVKQNSKMVKVSLGQDVLAVKGAMVAYQGQVTFNHEGSGSVGKFIRRALTNEDTPLMRVAGQGEVFFARMAEDIFFIQLEGDGISINGTNLLAFDANLSWDVHRVQGAGMLSGGSFNTIIQGQGNVAITSDGPPMILDCSQQPTFVDMQAAVAWSANLSPQVVSSMNMKSLLRGGSGEAFQFAFHGPGFVVVQPSEGQPLGGPGGGQQQQAGGLGQLFS